MGQAKVQQQENLQGAQALCEAHTWVSPIFEEEVQLWQSSNSLCSAKARASKPRGRMGSARKGGSGHGIGGATATSLRGLLNSEEVDATQQLMLDTFTGGGGRFRGHAGTPWMKCRERNAAFPDRYFHHTTFSASQRVLTVIYPGMTPTPTNPLFYAVQANDLVNPDGFTGPGGVKAGYFAQLSSLFYFFFVHGATFEVVVDTQSSPIGVNMGPANDQYVLCVFATLIPPTKWVVGTNIPGRMTEMNDWTWPHKLSKFGTIFNKPCTKAKIYQAGKSMWSVDSLDYTTMSGAYSSGPNGAQSPTEIWWFGCCCYANVDQTPGSLTVTILEKVNFFVESFSPVTDLTEGLAGAAGPVPGSVPVLPTDPRDTGQCRDPPIYPGGAASETSTASTVHIARPCASPSSSDGAARRGLQAMSLGTKRQGAFARS